MIQSSPGSVVTCSSLESLAQIRCDNVRSVHSVARSSHPCDVLPTHSSLRSALNQVAVGGSFHPRDASSSRHGCGGSTAREGPGWSRSTNPTLASGWDPTSPTLSATKPSPKPLKASPEPTQLT